MSMLASCSSLRTGWVGGWIGLLVLALLCVGASSQDRRERRLRNCSSHTAAPRLILRLPSLPPELTHLLHAARRSPASSTRRHPPSLPPSLSCSPSSINLPRYGVTPPPASLPPGPYPNLPAALRNAPLPPSWAPYRPQLINLLRYGVTPVFVLEGAAPDAKHGRLVQR